jgi:hypothetical protein
LLSLIMEGNPIFLGNVPFVILPLLTNYNLRSYNKLCPILI